MFPACSLNVHGMFTEYSLGEPGPGAGGPIAGLRHGTVSAPVSQG
jgi:hypothetical protein